MTKTSKLSFVGAGNMAKAILSGLLAKNYPPAALTACDPFQQDLDWIEQHFGIDTSQDNSETVASHDVLVICVKPQVVQQVCEGLRDQVQLHRPLIISIAAGITISQLERWLGDNVAVIRSMPNTPAQVHFGAAGLFANEIASTAQRALAQQIFEAVGMAVWVSRETDLHSVTALSGSGPAYCFLFLDAMESAARELGLPASISHDLAIQTMRGAAELSGQSSASPDQLMRRVMSPGGTTERAINRYQSAGLKDIVKSAMYDAWKRSYELAGDKPPLTNRNT